MGARASCSSRSSAAGSAGARGWAPARGSSRSTRPRSSSCPSSATSRYDQVAKLEPTVPLPRGRPRVPREPLRRRRDARALRPRRRHGRGARRRRRGDRRPARGRDPVATARRRGASEPIRRFPDRERYEEMVAIGQGAHRRRRRLPVRPVPARRATDLGHAARRLPRASPREPVAVPLPPRPRRARARRLVARAPRRVRGRPGEPLPDRRDDRADRGRRRAAALVGEGPRRARDARRPRAQRPLARLPRGNACTSRASMEVERFSHVSHLVSEVVGELRDGVTPFDVLRACFPAGTVTGAPKIRAMQLDLRARGLPARPVRRRRPLRAPGRHDGRMHRAPDDGHA